MTKLERAESLLPDLSREEKVRLLDRLLVDLGKGFPGIESRPGVAGGDPCVVRTRIPVWTLVRARQLGASDPEILESYPSLRSDDLAHAWAYSDLHRDEIEQQIQANEVA